MNQKNVYNQIIGPNESQHILNEKAGVIEFDNFAYRKQIQNIVNEIKTVDVFNESLYDVTGNNAFRNYKFVKLTYDFSDILTWLKTLNVYYATSADEFDAGALTADDNVFIKNNGVIDFGTIYIIDNGKENLLFVLFHEMCHLYDHSKLKEIWYNDEDYFFRRQHLYDINDYKLRDNMNKYTVDDIHNIITESMYYANYTESHAFMENINFEMFEYLNKRKKEFYAFKELEEFFYGSSHTLYGIYILENLLGKLKNISQEKKETYNNLYLEEINSAYYSFNSFDKVVNYQYRKLHKIISHSRVLFNYYYNLDSVAMQSFNLNEKFKRDLLRGVSSTILHRRKMEVND